MTGQPEVSSEPAAGRVAGSSLPFSLRVQALGGATSDLSISARDEAEAVRRANAQGLRVLSIESVMPVGRPVDGGGRFPLMLFSQELLTLLESGLHLPVAMAALVAKERHAAARATLQAIVDALHSGGGFSDALAAHPRAFPEVFVATMRASERTGDLPNALARYIAYQAQLEGVRKRLIAASIYPCILLLVGAGVSLFLMGFVVPRFSVLIESTGHELPWLSARLLDFGRMVHDHARLVAAMAILVIGGAVGVVARPAGRAAVLETVIRLPGIRSRFAQFRIARLLRALGLLLSSGVPLPRALDMVDGLLGSAQRHVVSNVRRRVEEGQALSSSLTTCGLSDPIVDSLVQIGERSGQLAPMLERAARFHDEAFARWLEWSTRLLEPALMIVIGTVVGAIVVLMYMPIFELAGSLE